MPSMQHLDAFVRVIDRGSFTAAAHDLGVRQATVSRWIAALEDEVGARLLDRTTRAVRVTEVGARFEARARDVLAAWSAALDEVRDTGRLTGRLRVNVPVVFGRRVLAGPIRAFAADHPNLALEVRYDDRYIDLVEEGVDVAIRVGRRVDVDYRARTLATTARRIVASPAWVQQHGAPAHPRALDGAPAVNHAGRPGPVTWPLRHGGDTAEVRLQCAVVTNHSGAALDLVEDGHGVALLADWLVDDAIRAGRLVQLLPTWTAPDAPVQALFGSARYVPRAARAFADAVADALRAGGA